MRELPRLLDLHLRAIVDLNSLGHLARVDIDLTVEGGLFLTGRLIVICYYRICIILLFIFIINLTLLNTIFRFLTLLSFSLILSLGVFRHWLVAIIGLGRLFPALLRYLFGWFAFFAGGDLSQTLLRFRLLFSLRVCMMDSLFFVFR